MVICPLTLLTQPKRICKLRGLRPNLDSVPVGDESLWMPYLIFLTAQLGLCFTEAVYISNQSGSGNVADGTGLPEKHNICWPA